jgi:hypothetical protein
LAIASASPWAYRENRVRARGRVDTMDDKTPEVRLTLQPQLSGRGVLDGGWWPRSADPMVELPGLIAALDSRVGTVFRIALNHATWDSTPRKITTNGHVVKLGWYGPKDVHQISVSGAGRDRLDLLMVPPHASQSSAEAAMATAADSSSIVRATQILDDNDIDSETSGKSTGHRPSLTAALPGLPAPVANGTRPLEAGAA